MTFGEYAARWKARWKPRSEGQRKHYEEILRSRVLPQWQDYTFQELHGVALTSWVGNLGLSTSRIRNILSPMRRILDAATVEYDWQLRDPFDYLRRTRTIPKRKQNIPEVFRFAEAKALLAHIEPHFAPIAALMLHTGMIFSELNRLRPADVADGKLHIHGTKTETRDRRIPMTPGIHSCLDQMGGIATWRDGTPAPWDQTKATASRFRNGPWKKTFPAAGLAYRRPYTTRHTFAAWQLAIGTHPDDVVDLMGHANREMIYRVYGLKAAGVREDVEQIRAYLGG